jgi:hypothetical protein
MTTHPAIPQQMEDEDWVDWFLRAHDAVIAAPPAAPPGFTLLACEAEPRHLPAYVIDDGASADCGSCWQCAYEALAAEHSPCAHKQHGAWRTWKASRKVASGLYTLGLLSGFGTTHSKDCPGCLVGIHWSLFRGPYVLFTKRETWRCWRAGHRRGVHVGFGFCGKCVPWHCCGSTGRDHAVDCADGAS